MRYESGQLVTAVPFGLEAARANNKLAEPDPALPTLEGFPDRVSGTLTVREVHAPWGSYTQYDVDGVLVDPDSIVPQAQEKTGDAAAG